MIKKSRFPKIFFGWWTVVVTGIMAGSGSGFYNYGFSVFFKPLTSELGFSRAVTSVAAAVGRLEGGLTSPIAGWLADKFGPRWVIFVGTWMVAIGLVLMNFISSLWAFYIVWGALIGFGVNLAYTVAPDKAIANWFVRKRGIALGTRFVCWGIGNMIVLQAVTWLVTTLGWRTTNFVWAWLIFATIPAGWFLVKQNRPEYYNLLPDGAKTQEEAAGTEQMIDKGVEYAAEIGEVEFTVRQAWKTRSYWMLLVAWCTGMVISGGINIHFIPFLTDIGISPTRASSMMAMMLFFTIPSRFLGGIIGDRIGRNRLQFSLAFTFLLVAAGITALVLKQTIAMIYVFLILYGLGFGGKLTLEAHYREPVLREESFWFYPGKHADGRSAARISGPYL